MVEPNGVLDDGHREPVAVRLGVGHGASAYPNPVKATQPLNGQVLQAAKKALRVVLRRGGKVIWDATNTRRDFRRVPIGLGLDYGALTTLAVFQPPVSTLLGRNPGRLHSVPPTVLAQQIDNAEFPYQSEAYRTLWLDEYHRETGRAGFSQSPTSALE